MKKVAVISERLMYVDLLLGGQWVRIVPASWPNAKYAGIRVQEMCTALSEIKRDAKQNQYTFVLAGGFNAETAMVDAAVSIATPTTKQASVELKNLRNSISELIVKRRTLHAGSGADRAGISKAIQKLPKKEKKMQATERIATILDTFTGLDNIPKLKSPVKKRLTPSMLDGNTAVTSRVEMDPIPRPETMAVDHPAGQPAEDEATFTHGCCKVVPETPITEGNPRRPPHARPQVVTCSSLGGPVGSRLNVTRAKALQADFLRHAGEWPGDTLTRGASWLPPLVRLVAFSPASPLDIVDSEGQHQTSFAVQGWGVVAVATPAVVEGSPRPGDPDCGELSARAAEPGALGPCEAQRVASAWVSHLRSWLTLPPDAPVRNPAGDGADCQGSEGGLPLWAAKPRPRLGRRRRSDWCSVELVVGVSASFW
ncbi:unnamed protein product [Prorocentrum cordatum]|uniref:Uncharacterized protein n=1 Tax=Prorocentrum cordatum TaxID=2364126 RepID=A0ABN9SN51_9DINO|nr:unnamed protein product [Polarella glacialis]